MSLSSLAAAPPVTAISCSTGMPARRARPRLVSSTAAPWFTVGLATVSLVYGQATGRLAADGVAISSADIGRRSQAAPRPAAMRDRLDHRTADSARALRGLCPHADVVAFS